MVINCQSGGHLDYFVSIEHTNYFGWQIELLIESFKKLNLQDNLLIGIASSPSTRLPKYFRNLEEHKRQFQHQNIGRDRGCLGLNRLMAIINALDDGSLKQPFAVIHADMVLISPIPEPQLNNSITCNAEYIDPLISQKIDPFIKPIMEVKGLDTPPALPVGSVMVFNGIPDHFFKRVYQRAMQLLSCQPPDQPIDWDVEKGAWILTFYENLGFFAFRGANYASPIAHTQVDAPLIHYKHGIVPNFHKLHFMSDGFTMISMGVESPYDAILQQNPIACTEAVQNIVKEINIKNKDQELIVEEPSK